MVHALLILFFMKNKLHTHNGGGGRLCKTRNSIRVGACASCCSSTTHRITPQHTIPHRTTPQLTTTHRNTPQHTATHCNTSSSTGVLTAAPLRGCCYIGIRICACACARCHLSIQDTHVLLNMHTQTHTLVTQYTHTYTHRHLVLKTHSCYSIYTHTRV